MEGTRWIGAEIGRPKIKMDHSVSGNQIAWNGAREAKQRRNNASASRPSSDA